MNNNYYSYKIDINIKSIYINMNMDILINNIINILKKENVFDDIELKELTNSITNIFNDYILDNILSMSSPEFDKNLTKYIYEIHAIQLLHLYDISIQYKIRHKIRNLIKKIKQQQYKKFIPPRSYKTSFIRDIMPNIESLQRKIDILKLIPQPIQRSEEWYLFRHNLLTASSIWKVFGSQATQNQLIYEKCKTCSIYKNASTNSPLHWGQKYEPVSVEFYKKLYKTEITDFGCIKHSQYPFIGASPDGINTLSSSPRFGRMLEIKNIVNRIITGIPKLEYWIQMQLQMETCNLNECDFLETKFIEYENENEFIKDGSFTYSVDNKLKGIIIMFSYEGIPHYEYAPIYITNEEYSIWEKDILEKNIMGDWIQNIYWKLEKFSNVLVLRNKLWFAAAVPFINNFWNTIVNERITGFEHRAPKKRKIVDSNLMINKCFINVSLIKEEIQGSCLVPPEN
jgi:putative phage-type endonuclease